LQHFQVVIDFLMHNLGLISVMEIQNIRDEYFDQELYNQDYAVERTNAWMDSFRSLLNRFDTTIESWE